MAIDVVGLAFAANSRTRISAPAIEIPIDAAEVIGHRFGNTLSDDPLEDGSVITDHVLSRPEELTIEGFVSDFPVEIFGGIVSGGGADALGRIAGSLGADVATPRQTAYDLLVWAVTEHIALEVVTSLGTYTNMMPESLDISQTRETAHALRFRLALRKIRTASTDEAQISAGGALSDLASGVSDLGFQPAL